LTESALKVVCNYAVFKAIIVVVGPLYKETETLKDIVKSDARVALYRNATGEEMLQYLLNVELAIVPASGVLSEAIAAGTAAVSGFYVDNQKLVYEAFKSAGGVTDAGNFSAAEIEKAVRSALEKPRQSKKIIDGHSRERLLKRFEQLVVSNQMILREADIRDMDKAYHWTNHRAIRAFSFSKDPVSWETHVNWFSRKIGDPKCFYYMGELSNETIGSVRFDIDNDDAVISYLVDPRFHSLGYGLPLLVRGLKTLSRDVLLRRLNVRNVVGYVMPDNHSSVKTFVNLGFKKFGQEGKIKFVKPVYATIN
jgi:RimJ/RimL family protein N-acetyltransferase